VVNLSASPSIYSSQDKIKLAVAGVVVLAAIVGYYVLVNSPFALRAGLVVAGLVVALVIAWTSQPGKDFIVYCQDSTTETKKVVWPSRKETLQTTGVVVAFVIVMAIFLWAVDASLVVLVRVLVGREA
jgi:preprotein translocase subunit SecE